MRRIRKLIGDIQVYCEDGVVPDGKTVQTLATEYAAACTDANQRLKRCSQFIRKGNPGEALRLARMKPDLLTLCRALDFDGVSYWRDIAERGRLPLPEPVDAEALRELTGAAGSSDVREPLMRQYRVAVQRRDEEECVAILRQLVEIDPENPNWREDLRRFERKRLGSMEREIMDAAERDDRGRLEELLEELQGAWTVRLKKGLKAGAVKHLDRIRREEAAVRYQELLSELESVEDRGDVTAGRAALVALEDLHAQGLVLLDDSASKTVVRVRGWVEQTEREAARQRAFDLKLDELRRELAKDPPDRDVGPLLTSLLAMKMPLPDGVADQARAVGERYRDIQRRTRARRRRRIVLGVAMALVTLLALAWFGALQTRSRVADEALSAAFKAQDLPAFDEALAAAEDGGVLFGKRAYRSSAVQGWLDRRSRLVDTYASRVERNEEAWARLGVIRHAAFDASSETIEGLLSKVGEVSLGAGEASSVERYRAEWHAAKGRALEEVIAQLGDAMLADDAFTSLTVAQFDEKVEAIEALLAEGRALEPVPGSLRTELEAISMRLSAVKRMAHGRRDRLAAMTKATSTRDYVEAIEAYVAAYPDDQLAVALSPLAARALHYSYVDAIKPSALYTEYSARIPFMKLVVDTFYPTVPEENYFWSNHVRGLETMHRNLEAKWSAVKSALLSLRDDRFLVALWEYQEMPDSPVKFVDVQGLATLPGEGGESVECPVYTPRARDASPAFRADMVKTRDVTRLRPVPHCEFLSTVISEAVRLEPSEGDEYLLRKIGELVRLEGVPGEFLRSSLLLFFLRQYIDLGLESDVQVQFKNAYLELARLGDRIGVSWLCRENRYVKDADAKAADLIDRHFRKKNTMAVHRFNRMLQVASFGRGVAFAGSVSAESEPPAELRVTEPCEVWVLRPEGEERCRVEVVAERDASGALSWSGVLQPGEPLFAPDGETRSGQLVSRFQETSGLQNGDVADVIWPKVWPVNRRGGVETSSAPSP